MARRPCSWAPPRGVCPKGQCADGVGSLEDGGDVDIADFAVVNQPASANRIGSDRGELSAVGLSGADREVTTPCTGEPEDGPEMISYLVLALRTTDPTHITYGKRLVARWEDDDGRTGQAVDDFSIVFCPRGSPTSRAACARATWLAGAQGRR